MDDNSQVQTSRTRQWQKIMSLPEEMIAHLENSLRNNCFSLEVREFLAEWIEIQQWDSVCDEATAQVYLSEMISIIKDCANTESFSIRRNLKKTAEKIEKHYENEPLKFIDNMKSILKEENLILQRYGQKDDDDDSNQQQNWTSKFIEECQVISKKIEQKLTEITCSQLFLQNNIDGNSPNNEMVTNFQDTELVTLFENLYTKLKDIQEKILNEDLKNWINNQKFNGNTTEELKKIQAWCSTLASLNQVSQQQIDDVSDLSQMNFHGLKQLLTELNRELIKRTFIILQQPPQVLTINNHTKSSVCLLLAEALNITSKSSTVTAELILDDVNKGTLRGNTSIMKMYQKENAVNFTKMKVTDVKRSKNRSGENVTDEKFVIRFSMEIEIDGEILNLQVSSFPVVVIHHVNQKCKAKATILWDNCFDEDAFPCRNKLPQTVHWPKFAAMLNNRFTRHVGVSLSPQDLQYFASKIFGETDNDLSTMSITWAQFCKTSMMDKRFSFWDWFYAIEKLIQNFLLQLYKDKLVIGFISKKQAEEKLGPTQTGTFLFRFSNNCLGSISIALKDSRCILHLSPFTTADLKKHPIVRLIQKNKKLLYVYPNNPKCQAFQNYPNEDPDERVKIDGYEETDIVLTFESDPVEEQTNSKGHMNNNHVSEMEISDQDNWDCFHLEPLPDQPPFKIFQDLQ